MIVNFVFIGTVILAKVAAECSDQTDVLPDLDLRGSNYTDGQNEDFFLPEKWYSTKGSSGHYKMADSNALLGLGDCGTSFPVYYKGTHPEVSDIGPDEMIASVCKTGFSSNCDEEIAIKIRKCANDRLEYYLSSLPENSGYCFDQYTPVEEKPPGNETLPASLEVKPRLTYMDVSGTDGSEYKQPNLKFICAFEETAQGYFYTIAWYANKQQIEEKGPSNDVDSLTLEEGELLKKGYGLGIMVQCRLRISTSIDGLQTLPMYSDEFFAGIKVISRNVVMQADQESFIEFIPTVPVGCQHNQATIDIADSYCNHRISMTDVDQTEDYTCSESVVAVKNSEWCGIPISGTVEETDDNWQGITYKMPVETTSVNYDDKHLFNVLLKTAPTGAEHKIWQNYEIDQIQIQVVDNTTWHYSMCYSVMDPHMGTADGGYYTHHNKEGEYLMYENIKYDIVIQEKITDCWPGSYAKCACAVSVRAGGDIFTINVCGRTRVIDFLSCKDEILDVRVLDYYWYQIYTPIGTYVDVNIWGDLLDIYVYMSRKDLNNIVGLCGSFDGDYQNDFVHRNGSVTPYTEYEPTEFTDSWRIDPADSYINSENWDPPLYGESFTFCVCKAALTPGEKPSDDDLVAICSKSQNQICEKNENLPTNDKPKKCSPKAKRSASIPLYRREIERKFALTDEMEFDQSRQIRTDSGQITDNYEDYYKQCSEALLNTYIAKSKDKRFSEKSLNNSIRNCAFDFNQTNDEQFITAYKDMNNRVVNNFNFLDVKYVRENPNEVLAFKNNSCPGNCSNHGVCAAGMCICDSGYEGAACNIDLSDGPDITDVQNGGFCDRAEGECGCYNGQADNIMEVFTCKIRRTELTVNDSSTIEESVIPGEHVDIFNGECCIPVESRKKRSAKETEQTFVVENLISISNDGNNFGSARIVYEYDSSCQEYSIDISTGKVNFRMKPGYCFIGGICVPELRSQLVDDDCYLCRSGVSVYGWSIKQGGCGEIEPVNQPASKSHTSTYIITGSVGGFMVIVIIVLVFAVIKLKKKKTVHTSCYDDSRSVNVHRPTTPQTIELNINSRGGGYEDLKRFQVSQQNTDYSYLKPY